MCVIVEVAEALAYERKRGEKSKYAPYINVLPTLEDDNLLALPRFGTKSGWIWLRMEASLRQDC